MKGTNGKNFSLISTVILISALAAPQIAAAQGQPAAEEPLEMGFFVTSVGVGDGGNLGGLGGADAHCKALADSAGVGHRTWRAYLSTQANDEYPAVNAHDRIGAGPWANAKGVEIADVSIFSRQFSTMINAGLPVLQCLSILAEQMDNYNFKKCLIALKDDIGSGGNLSDSMEKFWVKTKWRLPARAWPKMIAS